MSTTVNQILGRSDQGITRPFLCRADDGKLYYAKGNGAGRKALISEWVAGNFARCLNVPVPPFTIACVPPDLVALSAIEDIGDLGSGPVFASEVVENVDELSFLNISQIAPSLQATILLFDWWTANGDRTLTEHGGNPNILWDHRGQRPVVIDHNLAFDVTNLQDFWATHIFSAARGAWNAAFQDRMLRIMRSALDELPAFWAALPDEWTATAADISLYRACPKRGKAQ